ncbi:MAG: hypothetical protein KAI47_24490 [Deltaproteobacteria bacterium]|nr:hypothetical protein [Deltaproteobacteria bacterium]
MTDSPRSCGIYRTTEPIDEAIPAGAFVYYHNHGDPGPGVYLPESWRNNRAVFHETGTTIPAPSYAETLEPLVTEGFYRVTEPFYCCEKHCQRFEEDLLVQLGYNGDAQAILFVPELVEGAIALPAEGTLVDEEQLARLQPLKIPVAEETPKDVTLQ